MAELRNRDEIYGLSNRISLTLTHFAKGAYPVFSATPQALSVNRMLGIFENPNGAENFIRCGDDKLPLIPGTVYFIPAYLPAQVRLDDRTLFVSIQFSLELHSGVELFSMYKHIRSEYRPELVVRLVEIFDSDRQLLLAVELRKHVFAFVYDMLDGSAETPPDLAARFAPYAAVLDHIAARCTAGMRVAELAKIARMPRETFTRRFTADTGITPKRFLDRQLLRRASELLRRPHTTAREVAAELEFSSEFVFSRFFRKQSGLSPGLYRRQYRP